MSAEAQGSLPDGWMRVRFGDVVRNKNLSTKDPQEDGLDRIVGLTHLDSGSLPIVRWDILDGETSFSRTFAAGDVLFGKRRAYQRKVGVPDFAGICSGDILVFESKDPSLLQEFLPYIVQSDAFFERAVGTSAGSLSPRTNWTQLARFEFALPPLEEQKRVAELLWQTRDGASKQGSVIRRSEEVLWALLEEAASDASTSWIPMGEALLESPRNGATISPTSEPTGVWALTIGSAGAMGFNPAGTKPIRVLEGQEFAKVRPGELFITRSNTQDRVGLPFVAPKDLDKNTYFSDLLMRLRPYEDVIPTWLLELHLRSPQGRRGIRSISAGTSASMKKVNAKNVQKVLVPALSRPMLEMLRARLASLRKLQQGVNEAQAAAVQLDRAIRKALLEGEAHV